MKRRLFVTEWKKATRNKYFYFAMFFALLFCVTGALYMSESEKDRMRYGIGNNDMRMASSLYNSWIGGEMNSLGSVLFFYLFPMLAVLPYGWSYFQEKGCHYAEQLQIRCGRKLYYRMKYFVTFLTGGVVILFPLLINLFLTAMFVPARKPDVMYDMYFGVFFNDFLSDIFYVHPLLFVGIYLLIDFIYGGLFACMGLWFSSFVKKKIAVLVFPFLTCLVLHYATALLNYKVYVQISPLCFLHAVCIDNPAHPVIIWGEALFLFFLTYVGTMKMGRRHEFL